MSLSWARSTASSHSSASQEVVPSPELEQTTEDELMDEPLYDWEATDPAVVEEEMSRASQLSQIAESLSALKPSEALEIFKIYAKKMGQILVPTDQSAQTDQSL